MLNADDFECCAATSGRINMVDHLVVRPLCACCGGGLYRKGYTHTKSASRKHNLKSKKKRRRCEKRDTIRTQSN